MSSDEDEVQLRRPNGDDNEADGDGGRPNLVVHTVHRQESIHLFLVPFKVQIAGHGSEDDGHR